MPAANIHAQEPRDIHHRCDSLNNIRTDLTRRQATMQERLTKVRQLFSSGATGRDAYSEEIIRLEKDIFSLRDTIAIVDAEIRDIEKLRLPGGTEQTTGSSVSARDARTVYFVNTDFIRGSLPAAEYRQLTISQEQERTVDTWLKTIKYNHDQLVGLDSLYARATKGPRADSLFSMITRLSRTNATLADSVAEVWQPVFDNKVYTYNYILDRGNERAVMTEMERGMREMLSETEEIEGEYMYDAVARYPLQKELILAYEIRISERAGLSRAADSLRAAARNMDDGMYFLPAVKTKERLFLDYSDYKVTQKPVYNNSNPIPATQIHSKGTIYRIFVGAFSQPQPVSLFRNVSPLSREVKKDKLNYYYIGGYATYNEAVDASARLKKHGFKNPRVVVWVDGKYNEKPVAPTKNVAVSGNFRVEIRGAESGISAEMTALIRKTTPGKEISRIPDEDGGYVFVVGIFDDRTTAEKLMKAIAAADGGLQVKVSAL